MRIDIDTCEMCIRDRSIYRFRSGRSTRAALYNRYIRLVESQTATADGDVDKRQGYLISWCVGHLVQLAEAAAYGEQYRKWQLDSLPILPEEWQYAVDPDKGKQFATLKELMHRTDVSEVVNACDAVSYTHLDVYKRQVLRLKCPV